MAHITIDDTTLRDGEQAAGVAFTVDEKIETALMLDRAGVDQIEAGIPAMGPVEVEAVRGIVMLGLKAKIIGWNRAVESDIEASVACGVWGLAVSLPVSDILMEAKLGWGRERILSRLREIVTFAKRSGCFVNVGCEDASRADRAFLEAYAKTAEQAGADRIRYCDTLGIMNPFSIAKEIGWLTTVTGLPVEVHSHNDLGMATANAFAAVVAGAASVNVTVNGLGERAGNAALEELAMALASVPGYTTSLDLYTFYKLSKHVERISHRRLALSKPIVGEYAFAHEAGIHVDGLLKNPLTYETYDPRLVGQPGRKIILGKHSGRSAVEFKLREAGLEAGREGVSEILDGLRARSASGQQYGVRDH